MVEELRKAQNLLAFSFHARPRPALSIGDVELYEEIVAHSNLSMMTKLTDCVVATDYFVAKERSEAFRKAWIGATEATLIERKERKLLPSDLD